MYVRTWRVKLHGFGWEVCHTTSLWGFDLVVPTCHFGSSCLCAAWTCKGWELLRCPCGLLMGTELLPQHLSPAGVDPRWVLCGLLVVCWVWGCVCGLCFGSLGRCPNRSWSALPGLRWGTSHLAPSRIRCVGRCGAMASLLASPAELATLTSLNDVVTFAAVEANLWALFAKQLGNPPSVRILAMVPASVLQKTILGLRIPSCATPADGTPPPTREITGADPLPEVEPTDLQVAAMEDKVVMRDESPYVDFSILTPFGRRIQRAMKTKSYSFQPDGTWKAADIPGPPQFQAWQACFRVYRAVLFMLRYNATAAPAGGGASERNSRHGDKETIGCSASLPREILRGLQRALSGVPGMLALADGGRYTWLPVFVTLWWCACVVPSVSGYSLLSPVVFACGLCTCDLSTIRQKVSAAARSSSN